MRVVRSDKQKGVVLGYKLVDGDYHRGCLNVRPLYS